MRGVLLCLRPFGTRCQYGAIKHYGRSNTYAQGHRARPHCQSSATQAVATANIVQVLAIVWPNAAKSRLLKHPVRSQYTPVGLFVVVAAEKIAQYGGSLIINNDTFVIYSHKLQQTHRILFQISQITYPSPACNPDT